MKNKENEKLLRQEEPEEIVRPRRKSGWKTFTRVVDRIFGVFLATVIMAGIAGLGVGYIVTSKNYPSLRETVVVTLDETRRFRFAPRVYLSDEECDDILARRNVKMDEVMDPSLIHIAAQEPLQSAAQDGEDAIPQNDPYGYVDEDGDGVILAEVSGRGYNGYMLIVLDPTRCFVAQGGPYQTINAIAERTGAIGGINGGAFIDVSGAGNGGQPEGLTYIDGVKVQPARKNARESFAGFDAQGILHVGYFNAQECEEMGIVGGVTFEPALIINGVPQDTSYMVSGVNPRTAIGQRADGAVLMLVIDGRQLSSAGATYADIIDVMLRFGAVNAMNLDGGSSTVMYLNGELVNTPSSQSGFSRGLPNAFMFR